MRQAIWTRKSAENDHRDFGEWRDGVWFHFLEKGEECLGHKGKGGERCHNYKGKIKKKGKKNKVKKVERKGIAPKTPVSLSLLEQYQSKEGFKVLDLSGIKKKLQEYRPKIKPNCKKDRNEEWLKNQGSGFRLGDLLD